MVVDSNAVELETMDNSENLVFEDERVFRRLRVYDASMVRFARECADAMRSSSTLTTHVKTLQRIAEEASQCRNADLEKEESSLWEDELRTEWEEEMYEPLVWCNIRDSN